MMCPICDRPMVDSDHGGCKIVGRYRALNDAQRDILYGPVDSIPTETRIIPAEKKPKNAEKHGEIQKKGIKSGRELAKEKYLRRYQAKVRSIEAMSRKFPASEKKPDESGVLSDDACISG